MLSITDATSNANVINSSDVEGSIANITTVVNAGKLDKTGSWYLAIKAIKDANP